MPHLHTHLRMRHVALLIDPALQTLIDKALEATHPSPSDTP
ncbi:hypothetical protein [Hylemonella gracilis]|uniref:Uncharacterized protein n=1 Tax=Hylemonella gracilis ATCC 19624 TaxID=887062 RepID=F3KQC9_9BURK|nr:hypothetical protein [Hylemonella gracilis]EGI78002.1 hypothetical protein HGR_03222 [Hylemonella gracilis ATCC 19624]